MDIRDVLIDWGVNPVAAVAGTIGAFAYIILDEKQFDFKTALGHFIVGVAFSGYGTELLAKWWRLSEMPYVLGPIGLCIGISATHIFKGVLSWAKKAVKNPEKYIKKRGDDVTDA